MMGAANALPFLLDRLLDFFNRLGPLDGAKLYLTLTNNFHATT